MQAELLACMNKILSSKAACTVPPDTAKGASEINNDLFNGQLLDDAARNSVFLVVKNYFSATKKGVSHQLHSMLGSDLKFFVKGPCGLGTKFIPNNTNVCFVGGTAILSIIDFIARFVLYNCGIVVQNQNSKVDMFGKNFKLVLFYAVESEAKALFLPLLRSLVEVTAKNGLNNF